MNVRFCPACRSLILSDFRFCPYCGSPAGRGPGLAEALEGPFDKIEEATPTREPAAEHFAELEDALARLESDMDLLMGELEKPEGKKG
jgi:hypothetical protein